MFQQAEGSHHRLDCESKQEHGADVQQRVWGSTVTINLLDYNVLSPSSTQRGILQQPFVVNEA